MNTIYFHKGFYQHIANYMYYRIMENDFVVFYYHCPHCDAKHEVLASEIRKYIILNKHGLLLNTMPERECKCGDNIIIDESYLLEYRYAD